MTSNYLAMLVMFSHLVIKECQIDSNFFTKENAKKLPQFVMCLTKHIIQKENILFMFYHIHVTFKFTEYSVFVSTHTCEI